jgi:hexulose-6-phosphate isomerase
VTGILHRVLPALEERKLELHLETSLGPEDFSSFLRNLESPWIKVNYDSGNSSSLGFDPREEFAAYGRRIGSIHIKDRVRGGGTVPLGEGDTNFEALFSVLREIHYTGDYILQVTRGESGDEVNWARQNREFLLRYLNVDGQRVYGARN